MIWTSNQLAAVTGGKVFSNWSGKNIVFDSRLIEKDDIFLALDGATSDGHDHVLSALENGAAGAIVSKLKAEYSSSNKILIVDDCFDALNKMAKYKREKSKAIFIGVTGSVGKTSTKELLGLALSEFGNTFVSRANYNNFLGLPINLASLPDDVNYAVIEMGMDHAGEIEPLSLLSKPDIAIITMIEKIHIENFESIEAIADAKAEIFRGIKQNGIAIINYNSNCFDFLSRIINQNEKITKTYALGIDTKIISYQVEDNSTKAELSILGNIVEYKINYILGIQQINNIASTLLCIASLGLDIHTALVALEKFTLPVGRGFVSKVELNGKMITLIDDSYNAGPVSVKAAINTLSYYNGRKIALLGDMAELGAESLELHLALKDDLITNKIDLLISFGEKMGQLAQILPIDKQLSSYYDLKLMAKELPDLLIDGDVLLIKGSHYLTKLHLFARYLREGKLDAL